MITVDQERCTGCGACVEVCPTGALYLVDGRVAMDGVLCRECEACLAACPSGAITLAAQEEPTEQVVRLPALRPEGHRRPEPEVIQVRTLPPSRSLRSRALPVVGTALAWAGREILPRLAVLMLDTLDRQTARSQAKHRVPSRETLASGARESGRQRRHRRRGGGG